MREVIRSHCPDHAIVGEEAPLERGDRPNCQSGQDSPGGPGDREEWIWYLDPLDGTRAFSIGQDNCSVAATLTRDGTPLVAAVAAPLTGELYTAISGRPSECDGRAIRVADSRPITEREFLLYYDRPDAALAAIYGEAARGSMGRMTVRPGSFILNACRAARGAYDVFLAVKRGSGPLMPWDLAPAALVLGGAGGILQDLEARPLGGLIPAREVIAGSPEAAGEIVRSFGANVRDPRPELAWARDNEAVFARLIARILSGLSGESGRDSGETGRVRLVGVGGSGGGVGKTSFARELAAILRLSLSSGHHPPVAAEHGPSSLSASCPVISLDDYLIPRQERDARNVGAHNPAATDLRRAREHLARLRGGGSCEKPVYDHGAGCARAAETIEPAPVVIVEGVMALHEDIRPLLDIGVYLDAPAPVRFRRVERDVEEKQLSEAYARQVFERFERDVKQFLAPMLEHADVVLDVDESYRLTWRD